MSRFISCCHSFCVHHTTPALDQLRPQIVADNNGFPSSLGSNGIGSASPSLEALYGMDFTDLVGKNVAEAGSQSEPSGAFAEDLGAIHC